MNLRDAYDQWHEGIFAGAPEHPDETSPWYRLVLEYLGPIEGKRILEVACGRGGFVRLLASRGARVVGSDFSISALRIAQQKLRSHGNVSGQGTLVQTDAQRLPYADESFDVVLSCETIEHLPDQRRALCEMWRVARPGARLFLTSPNYFNWMGLYELYSLVRHPHRKDDQPFDRRQVFFQVRQWIRRAGWRILCSDGTVHQFPFIPRRNPVNLPILETSRTVRRILSPFALHYFVLARKGSA